MYLWSEFGRGKQLSKDEQIRQQLETTAFRRGRLYIITVVHRTHICQTSVGSFRPGRQTCKISNPRGGCLFLRFILVRENMCDEFL